jgi:hypothetical protein
MFCKNNKSIIECLNAFNFASLQKSLPLIISLISLIGIETETKIFRQ